MENGRKIIEKIKKYQADLEALNKTEIKYMKNLGVKSVMDLEIEEGITYALVSVDRLKSAMVAYFPITSKYENFKIPSEYVIPLDFSIAELGNCVYIIGGYRTAKGGSKSLLNELFEINFFKKYTTYLKSFSIPRRRVASVSMHDSEIYIIGGDNCLSKDIKAENFFNSCERYDLLTKNWTPVPSINEARTNISSGVFDGHIIYIFSGSNLSQFFTTLIERFDVDKGIAWEKIDVSNDPLWKPLQCMGVIQISKEEILLFGGEAVGYEMNQSLIFNVKENKFEKTNDMEDEDIFLGEHPKVISNVVYVFGCRHGRLHLFDIGTKKWKMIMN